MSFNIGIIMYAICISSAVVIKSAQKGRASKSFVQPHLKSKDFKSGCKHEGVCMYLQMYPWKSRIRLVTRMSEE
jgi:hypothetical protein